MSDDDVRSSGDENDDLPQEVSVKSNKNRLEKEQTSIKQQIKTEKEKLKEKRRNHQLLCTSQKKQKPSDGKVKRKSTELEESPKKKRKDVGKNLVSPGVTSSAVEDLSNTKTDASDSAINDFIPLNSSERTVKPVYMKDFFKVNTALEKALAFKNKHLFGSHVHRQSMTNHLAMTEKRKARYSKTSRTAR